MVQNAQLNSVPQATNQASNSSPGLLGAVANTAGVALPGTLIGGGAGAVMSFLPVSKNLVRSEVLDLFTCASKGNIVSDGAKNLLKKPEYKTVIENFKNLFEQAKLKDCDANSFNALKETAFKSFDDMFSKLTKNDELLQTAKKAAKKASRTRLIKNGVLFGACAALLSNLLTTFKQNKASKTQQ
ncbi:MAG: hypothetical protein E7Z91_05760 [Cyanobacteria bacterium SIG30]|nr:hypothetical protein [Cyanobacteria bacterium SIG30]